MFFVFLSILVLAGVFTNLIYRHNGKKQLFSFDVVQFVYLFILSPLLLIWIKTFIFFILNTQIETPFSATEMFLIDTTFTVLSFYIFAAVAIHSLTKTFWLAKHKNPEFDIFHLSEYFHLWWSHIVISLGIMIAITCISLLNLVVPLNFVDGQSQFYLLIGIGLLLGVIIFFTIWSSDPQQAGRSFMKLMKLAFALFFIVHLAVYYLLTPEFSMQFGLYWFTFSAFLSASICSLFLEKSEKAVSLRKKMVHSGWGKNIELFKKL